MRSGDRPSASAPQYIRIGAAVVVLGLRLVFAFRQSSDRMRSAALARGRPVGQRTVKRLRKTALIAKRTIERLPRRLRARGATVRARLAGWVRR